MKLVNILAADPCRKPFGCVGLNLLGKEVVPAQFLETMHCVVTHGIATIVTAG